MNDHRRSHGIAHILLAFCLASITLALALFFPQPLPVYAATLTVNTLADTISSDGFCSLREAITAANNNANLNECTAMGNGADTISFSVNGTITLGSMLPPITDTLTINGAGASSLLTISGNHAVRVMQVNPGVIMNLSNITAANGSHTGGGGIYNGGILSITNSTFDTNIAQLGGGIYNLGTLNITNSTFDSNIAWSGGGIYNLGTLNITNSTFGDNRGCCPCCGYSSGGIHNVGTMTMTHSTLSNNRADFGSAIYNTVVPVTGSVTLRSTILDNSVYGGDNCSGPILSLGYNLDDGISCGFTATGDLTGTSPFLIPALQDNGGPTQTFALTKWSPAINHIPLGTNGCGTTITTDQRGFMRVGPCDIGAFEYMLRLFLPLILK